MAKSLTNVMDVGTVTFTFTLTVLTSWNKTGRAVVDVPKSYMPNVGENVGCSLWKGADKLEDLYCDMQWDWSLKVWGPRAAAVD
jgi:hypothetical protein